MFEPTSCRSMASGTLNEGSADTALLLEALTGWDAQIWLTLQAKRDLWHAIKGRGGRQNVRSLRKTA